MEKKKVNASRMNKKGKAIETDTTPQRIFDIVAQISEYQQEHLALGRRVHNLEKQVNELREVVEICLNPVNQTENKGRDCCDD